MCVVFRKYGCALVALGVAALAFGCKKEGEQFEKPGGGEQGGMKIVFPGSSRISKSKDAGPASHDVTLPQPDDRGLKCNTWMRCSVGRRLLVKDCKKLTREEIKKLGDRVASAANYNNRKICRSIKCPKIRLDAVQWHPHKCSRRILTMSLTYSLKCKR